jgi:hypothetical protein
MSMRSGTGFTIGACLIPFCIAGVWACSAVLGIEPIPAAGDIPIDSGGKSCAQQQADNVCAGQCTDGQGKLDCDEANPGSSTCICPSDEGGGTGPFEASTGPVEGSPLPDSMGAPDTTRPPPTDGSTGEDVVTDDGGGTSESGEGDVSSGEGGSGSDA